MIYELECWIIVKRIEQKMSRRDINGKVDEWRWNNQRRHNNYIKGSIGVVLRKNKLRWFGHVLRREGTELVKEM